MLSNILKAVSNFKWQDWSAAAGYVFGIITLIAYIDQKKESNRSKAIIDLARRHLSKELTEEDLQSLTKQKGALEVYIAERIPDLARQTVLNEQARVHATALAEHYKQWEHIRREIGTVPDDATIDPTVEFQIKEYIIPQYERERIIVDLRSRLSIFSIALVVSGALFSPISYLINMVLLLPLMLTLFRIYILQNDDDRINANLKYLFMIASTAAMALFLIVGIACLLIDASNKDNALRSFGISCIIFSPISIIIYFIIKVRINEFIKHLINNKWTNIR